MKWQQVALLLAATLSIGGAVSYNYLFFSLFQLTGVNTTYSGDIVCEDVCESYINVTTSYWRICFDHYNGTKYEDEILFKKQTRSRTLHVNLNKTSDIVYTVPRVSVDWMVPARGNNWRLIEGGDCWERGKINRIKLRGYKEPTQTVKWNFNVDDQIVIDPAWIAISTDPCICAPINTNMVLNSSCLLNSDCNLGNGYLSFSVDADFFCNATLSCAGILRNNTFSSVVKLENCEVKNGI